MRIARRFSTPFGGVRKIDNQPVKRSTRFEPDKERLREFRRSRNPGNLQSDWRALDLPHNFPCCLAIFMRHQKRQVRFEARRVELFSQNANHLAK